MSLNNNNYAPDVERRRLQSSSPTDNGLARRSDFHLRLPFDPISTRYGLSDRRPTFALRSGRRAPTGLRAPQRPRRLLGNATEADPPSTARMAPSKNAHHFFFFFSDWTSSTDLTDFHHARTCHGSPEFLIGWLTACD